MPRAKKTKAASSAPGKLSKTWRDLLSLIPGYDPFATAGDAWFDPVLGQKVLDFFAECLRHVEGALAGKPFKLESWQQSFLANLFGWQRIDRLGRQVRRYRETLLYVPRKNGKTPVAAGICNYCLFCDDEPGAQIYSAAAEKEQAALLYRHAKGMIEQEPELDRRAVIYRALKSVALRADPASAYKVLSAEANTKHGGNSHLVLIDELHAQPSRDLVDVLLTSMASANRRQPLIVYITTADFARESICNEKHAYASKVRDGVIQDPSFLPVIYEATTTDDWTAPATWARVNPNLGVSVSLEYLERECQRAKETPAYENTFKRLHLNMKTEQDVRWLALDKWDACAGPLQFDQLAGRTCYAGLDLASTTDLAALVLLFPDDSEPLTYDVLPFFWIPQEGAHRRERRDRVPYETWARQGLITMTDGDVIDYDRIRSRINELGQLYAIKEIAIDRWNSTQLATQLAGDGFEVIAYGQGFASMSAPTKELESLILASRIRHGGQAVLRWNASNVSVEIDAAGNLKPSKKKSTEKIDGIVALIMGLGRAMIAPSVEPGVEFW